MVKMEGSQYDDLGKLEGEFELREELNYLDRNIIRFVLRGNVGSVQFLLKMRKEALEVPYTFTYQGVSKIRNLLAKPNLPEDIRRELEDLLPGYKGVLKINTENLRMHHKYSQKMLSAARKFSI